MANGRIRVDTSTGRTGTSAAAAHVRLDSCAPKSTPVQGFLQTAQLYSGQFRVLMRRRWSQQSAFLDLYSTCVLKKEKKLWFSNRILLSRKICLLEYFGGCWGVFLGRGCVFGVFFYSALFSLCVGKWCLKSCIVFNKKKCSRNSTVGWSRSWSKRALRTFMWIM